MAFNKSESIGALSTALSKLQGEVQNVYKDKKGYGYMYCDLSSILDLTRPLCAKYELAVTQLCTNLNELVGVETVLTHSSGEWISSVLYMPLQENKGMSKAQAAGSVITYARRYALAAILGIAQTDDDASVHEPVAPKQNYNKTTPAKETALINENDMLELQALADVAGSKTEDICKHYKINALVHLPKDKLPQLMAQLKQKLEKKEFYAEVDGISKAFSEGQI